jgi:hypothetical protein
MNDSDFQALATRVDAFASRIMKLEREVSHMSERIALQPEIDRLCAEHGVKLPSPDPVSGLVDASAVLKDLNNRPGFDNGRHTKAAAQQIQKLLRLSGWIQ